MYYMKYAHMFHEDVGLKKIYILLGYMKYTKEKKKNNNDDERHQDIQ